MNSGMTNSFSSDLTQVFRAKVGLHGLHSRPDLGTFTKSSLTRSNPFGIRLDDQIGSADGLGNTSASNRLHAENLPPKTPIRNSPHVAFSSHPTISHAGVMMQKPYASSSFEPYSSGISTPAGIPFLADGPGGLVVLGLALLSLAIVVFLKCKSSGRRRTVQL